MFCMLLIIFHFSFLLVKCENVSVVMATEDMPKASIALIPTIETTSEAMVDLDTKQL